MVVDATQIKIDNMLIKLHRITQELGSMTYQVKKLQEEHRSTKNLSHVSGGGPPQPRIVAQDRPGAGATPKED